MLDAAMTQLERIAGEHHVAIRKDGCGDPIIPSSKKTGWGHLYTDGGKVYVCLTDADRRTADGAPRFFKSTQPKRIGLQRLAPFLIRMHQEGEYEFIAEVADTWESIETAIRVLRIKRRRPDAGVSRPVPQGLRESMARRAP
jgi:hypothetical protein